MVIVEDIEKYFKDMLAKLEITMKFGIESLDRYKESLFY